MAKRVCPRCGMVPRMDDGYFHRGFGALSRIDSIYICSDCGVEEALQDFMEGSCTPRSDWPINKEKSN